MRSLVALVILIGVPGSVEAQDRPIGGPAMSSLFQAEAAALDQRRQPIRSGNSDYAVEAASQAQRFWAFLV